MVLFFPPVLYSGEKVSIVIIPKVVGIPYYVEVKRDGVDVAAAELPDADILWIGPSRPRVENQIRIIERILPMHPDVLAVAPNDAKRIVPILQKAADQGTRVMAWGADSDFRDIFVNLVDSTRFGRALVETLVEQMGPTGDIAIVTTSFTAPDQAEWITAIQKTIHRSYPGIHILTIRPAGEDTEKATRVTRDILRSYPDLSGIIALGSTNLPGAAQAVAETMDHRSVALTGNSIPSMMESYVRQGVVSTFWLWNGADHGYLTAYAAYRFAKDEIQEDVPFSAGTLGPYTPFCDARGLQVILEEPIKSTAETIDDPAF